jgi:hypothetical protein
VIIAQFVFDLIVARFSLRHEPDDRSPKGLCVSFIDYNLGKTRRDRCAEALG